MAGSGQVVAEQIERDPALAVAAFDSVVGGDDILELEGLDRRGLRRPSAKYAHATHADITVERSHGIATVVISDDGIGGAQPGAGSGLVGLTDRVEALEGAERAGEA